MNSEIQKFYNDLYNHLDFSQESREYINKLKKEYYKNKLTDEKIYKFISFCDDFELNNKKILTLKNQELWFGAFYTFKDNSELKLNINPYTVSRKTGKSIEEINLFAETFSELNDICCLTTSIRENMWNDYANNGNGICLEFKICSYEYIYPVIYTDKKLVDYTPTFISYFNNKDFNKTSLKRLSIEPNVLKNYKDYYQEDEVRLLCGDCYDDKNGPMGGRAFSGKKKVIGYTGSYYSYKKLGLTLTAIYLGNKLNQKISDRIKEIASEQNVQIINDN